MRSRFMMLAAAGGLAVAAGGCGTKTFKQDDLQDAIATNVAKQTALRADQVRVACPEDAEVAKGKTFTCDVTGPNGHTETATVTPTDDDGQFRFEVSSTIDADELEQSLAQQLSKSAGVDPSQVSVACPDGMTASKGKRFDCTLTAPNADKVRVVVTLTNSRGGFTATVPK